MSNIITRVEAINIIKNGTYYYPANKHYSNSDVIVVCDFCGKNNLNTSIGFNDKDLCLICVDNLSQQESNNLPYIDSFEKMNIVQSSPVQTFMMEDRSRPRLMTRMFETHSRPGLMTRMFETHSRPYTKNKND